MTNNPFKIFYYLWICVFINCSVDHHNKDLILFDTSGDYKIKSIDIQDIARVTYIIPEADPDFLFHAFRNDITESFILVKNELDGTFLFFDKEGKAVSKVDRQGNGPEEYRAVSSYLYIEEEDNLYISSRGSGIHVYDRQGNYRKRIPAPHDCTIADMVEYDADHLLCYSNDRQYPFFLLDKIHGLLQDVPISSEYEDEGELTRLHLSDFKTDHGVINNITFDLTKKNIVKNENDYLLTIYSNDTVYKYSHEGQLQPVMVRIPSIRKSNPMLFLHSWVETHNYIFFSSQRKEYVSESFSLFPKTGFMLEKSNGIIYTQDIRNADYKETPIVLDPFNMVFDGKFWNSLITYKVSELDDAARANQLTGELKKIYHRLQKDDEYIFMLISIEG